MEETRYTINLGGMPYLPVLAKSPLDAANIALGYALRRGVNPIHDGNTTIDVYESRLWQICESTVDTGKSSWNPKGKPTIVHYRERKYIRFFLALNSDLITVVLPKPEECTETDE